MNNSYRIVTDSASDMGEHLTEWGVASVSLTLKFEGEDKIQRNDEVEPVAFYNRMREGGVAKTSAVNPEEFALVFEPILAAGEDILYIGFSSGLSTTCNSGRIAADKLAEKYPERKMIVVDTLSISAPMSLLVMAAHDLYLAGKTMEEIEAWLMENRLRCHAWLTVDDLKYLRRGGRISSTSAIFGSMLDIKPIIVMGKGGKMDPAEKVQGRKKALRTICDRVAENIENAESQTVVILHGDVEEEAQKFAEMLKKRIPEIRDIRIQMIGPVIGAYCGPGTIAACFMGKEGPI